MIAANDVQNPQALSRANLLPVLKLDGGFCDENQHQLDTIDKTFDIVTLYQRL